MKEIIIKSESFPTRCEICHQLELFNREENYCFRCDSYKQKVKFNNLGHRRSSYLRSLISLKPRGVIANSISGLIFGLIIGICLGLVTVSVYRIMGEKVDLKGFLYIASLISSCCGSYGFIFGLITGLLQNWDKFLRGYKARRLLGKRNDRI